MHTFTILCLASSLGLAQAQHEFWFEEPAKKWTDALPVGNGRLGAMVFGNPGDERIQLNEDSMWAGIGENEPDSRGTPADLAALRKLIDEGKLAEADKFIINKFSFGSTVRSHQTLGNLTLNWQETTEEFSDYRRSLDLKTAVTTSTWKRADTTFTQEVYASNPAEAIFIRISANGPKTINLDIDLSRPKDGKLVTHQTVALDDAALKMTGQVTQSQGESNGKRLPNMTGVKFDSILRANAVSGKITTQGNQLQIRGAKEVYLRLTASTNFWNKKQQAQHHATNQATEFTSGNYAKARAVHIKDHQSLYNRCALNLPAQPKLDKLTTAERLTRVSAKNPDLGLEALIFHFGRYLLIASSRENGNPANLQGLWNEHIKAPWNCDYHLNINLQMNYWPAEVTNLSETHLPVFTWMQALAKRGANTARDQYGMRGWLAHHGSELSAVSTMRSSRAQWGAWIHGGGWMCQHIWTHYTYTQDKDFLKTTGYPLLAGQARFYLDWLTEENGKLISSPESSPENQFKVPSGGNSAICKQGAMGQQIIAEVLTNTLAAAKELGVDDGLTEEIESALGKLDKGLHIGPDGRLLEWDKPYRETQLGHRHLSHLYAFHPGISVTQEQTPKMLEAVKKSIAMREKHGSVGVGWSRAWAISIYARLRDGNTAEHHLTEMLRTQTLGNGFNSVFGKKRPLFQIEANLGATAGIAEMLIQSHGGQLHLLPALPQSWQDGSITGLKARGGHTIDLTWKGGKLTQATITKGSGKMLPLMLQGSPISSTDQRISLK